MQGGAPFAFFQLARQLQCNRIAVIQNGWLTALCWIFPPNESDRCKAFHFRVPVIVPKKGKQNSRHRGTQIAVIWNAFETMCDLDAALGGYGVEPKTRLIERIKHIRDGVSLSVNFHPS